MTFNKKRYASRSKQVAEQIYRSSLSWCINSATKITVLTLKSKGLNCKIKKRKTLFMTLQHENNLLCNKLYQRLLVRLLWDSAWPTWPRRIVLRYSNGTGWKCSCNKELQAENDHCHSVQYESLWKHEAAGVEWQFEQCSQALSIYIHQNKTRMYFKSLKGGVKI